MKYLMIDEAFPILFGDYFEHTNIKANVHGKVTSAGFVDLYMDCAHGKIEASTFGESISLKLKPSKFDEEIITRLVNGR